MPVNNEVHRTSHALREHQHVPESTGFWSTMVLQQLLAELVAQFVTLLLTTGSGELTR